jgi:hypothetical protein
MKQGLRNMRVSSLSVPYDGTVTCLVVIGMEMMIFGSVHGQGDLMTVKRGVN